MSEHAARRSLDLDNEDVVRKLHTLIKAARGSFSTIVLAATLAFVAACDDPKKSEAEHFNRGKAYFEEKQYDKARVEFQNAYQINPTNAEALYHIGLIAEARQKWREAFVAYSKVENQNPNHVGAIIRLGRVFLLANDLNKASDYAESVLKIDADNVEALALRGAVYFRKDDLAEAEVDALSALRLAPGDVPATTLLASIYAKQSRLEDSLRVIGNGLGAHPDEISLHLLKASLHLKADQKSEAEQTFLRLIERQPEKIAYRIALVRLYIAWDRKADAEKLLREAVRLAPEEDQPKLLLADFLANQKSFADAEKELNAFIKSAPENFSLRFGLATLYDRKEFREKASVAFEEIRKLDPKGQQGLVASNALARISFQEKKYDDARKLVASVLTLAPRNPDALLMRARLSMRDEAWSDAVVDLRSVLRDHPTSKAAYALLAAAHLKSQDWQLARDALEQLVKLAPKSEPARLDLVRVLLRLGAPNAAVDQLEKFSELVPDSLPAHRILAEILTRQGRYDEAQSTIEKLTSLESGKPSAEAALGRIYLQRKRYDDALAAYRSAMTLEPASQPHLLGAVLALISKKDYEAAIKEIDTYVGRNKANAYAFYLKGAVYMRQRALERARVSYRRAIEMQPKWKDPYLRLGQILSSRKETLGEALTVLKEGFEGTGGNEQVGILLAIAQQRNEDIDGAIGTYESILQRNAKHQIAANNLAALIADHRHGDRAQLEHALSLVERFRTSKHAYFLDTLGWVNFRLGNVRAAIAYLEQAVAGAPNATELKFHLSSAYIDNGQADLAREHLEFILEKESNSPLSKKAGSLLAKLPAGNKG